MGKARLISPISKQGLQRLRVAAYCRVSTSSADQLNSYSTQIRAYTKLISSRPDWELVEIFADEGISGMKADTRPEFQRMIKLCELRRIDLIITKSVARFARNVKEALEYVRKLKLLGVGIQFEKEGINTLALGDEMLLNTFAAIAQEESKSISQNLRLSIVKRMEMGEYVDSNAPYGFRLTDKELKVYEPEANVVRWIFDMYLQGWSTSELARYLTEHVVPTKSGKSKWTPSRELFNRTQEELSRRNVMTPKSKKSCITASGKYSKYALTEVLKCAECGSRYRRCTWTSHGHRRIVWRCINRLDYGKKYCPDSITVSETALQEAIVRALNHFNAENKATYLSLMKATIGEAIGLNGGSEEIDLLNRRIDSLNKKMMSMVNEAIQNGVDLESNEDEFKEISEGIEQLKRRITAIQESQNEDSSVADRLAHIQEIIDQREEAKDQYDDSIVRQMIECIKVHKDGKLTIIFGGGYEVEEYIE